MNDSSREPASTGGEPMPVAGAPFFLERAACFTKIVPFNGDGVPQNRRPG